MCCRVFLEDGWAWLSRIAFWVAIIGCFIISGCIKGDISLRVSEVRALCAMNKTFRAAAVFKWRVSRLVLDKKQGDFRMLFN